MRTCRGTGSEEGGPRGAHDRQRSGGCLREATLVGRWEACEWAVGWAPASKQAGGRSECRVLGAGACEHRRARHSGRLAHNQRPSLERRRRRGRLGVVHLCCQPPADSSTPGSRGFGALAGLGKVQRGAAGRSTAPPHRLSLHDQLALAGGQLEDLVLGGVHAHAVDVAHLLGGARSTCTGHQAS